MREVIVHRYDMKVLERTQHFDEEVTEVGFTTFAKLSEVTSMCFPPPNNPKTKTAWLPSDASQEVHDIGRRGSLHWRASITERGHAAAFADLFGRRVAMHWCRVAFLFGGSAGVCVRASMIAQRGLPTQRSSGCTLISV